MIWLATRLSTSLAVGLVAMVQGVVSPASCCLLKSTLSGAKTCCLAEAEPAPRSCCHRETSSAASEVPSDSDRHLPSPSDGCPVCSAEPKVAIFDRVEAPLPLLDGLFSLIGFTEPTVSSMFDASAFGTDEPFQRTALASCIFLCVWRI